MIEVQPWVKNIVEEMFVNDKTPHPVIGAIWVYKGKRVRITDGKFWGTFGISNCWGFRYLNSTKRGSCYDNDRKIFFPEVEGSKRSRARKTRKAKAKARPRASKAHRSSRGKASKKH